MCALAFLAQIVMQLCCDLQGAPLDVTKVKGFDTLRQLCVRARNELHSKAWKARVRLRRKIDLVKYT